MTRLDPVARERDLDDEIRIHLEMAVRERIARGECRAEAERAARAEFGDIVWVKAAARAAWLGAPALGTAGAPRSANDRLKDSFPSWFWTAMILAVLVHSGLFAFWPEMAAAVPTIDDDEIEVLHMPDIAIPPPPEPIPQPAFPVAADIEMSEDITIPRTEWDEHPVETLPPPPTTTGGDVSAAPRITPYEVRPEILNREEVARAMEREYPAVLRDARIGGTVRVYFFVDEQGLVRDRRIHEGSGHLGLDQAALAVAETFRFSPALNRDRRVPVWVSLPIRFQVGR